MKPANKQAILYGLASLCMFGGIFAKPLGMPETWSTILVVSGAIMLIFVIRMQNRAKAERERTGQPMPAAPLAARKKLFWIIALSLIAGSVGVLPLLPYTVDNFQPWIYFWVVPSQIIFLTVFLTFYWRKLLHVDASKLPDDTLKG